MNDVLLFPLVLLPELYFDAVSASKLTVGEFVHQIGESNAKDLECRTSLWSWVS